MELVDSDTTDSLKQSPRPVFFRPSRSRERRSRKAFVTSSKLRNVDTLTLTQSTNNEQELEMKDVFIKSSETLHGVNIENEEIKTRRKSKPVPIYNLDKIETISLVDETSKPKRDKLPQTETSGNTGQMSITEPSSSRAVKSDSDPDIEKFSSTLSFQREKSELSQIISDLFEPKSKGIRGKLHNFREWLYNKQNKTFCGRTCKSWLYIVLYAIIYLIFQMTFTFFWLYISLLIINKNEHWPDIDKAELQTYAQNGIGLSAVPALEGNLPLIWYKSKDPYSYKVYIDAIDVMLNSRTKNATELKSLGPCGQSPYGYEETPCIIIKINKQIGWSANALLSNSTLTSTAPPEVIKWIQTKQMLWLHCTGYNHYDREHISKIVYYPDPPGIDPKIFPLNMDKDSPIIGIQLIGYTKGMSIGIQCKLWYDTGTSAVEFVLYVVPEDEVNPGRALSKVY